MLLDIYSAKCKNLAETYLLFVVKSLGPFYIVNYYEMGEDFLDILGSN